MSKENPNKVKLIKLLEILRQETDEAHPLSTKALLSRLTDIGIACDRRTLSKDIAVLNENGFEVMSDMVGHDKVYYVADRSFSVPELKILIDAVQAAAFITEKKTDELITKIADMAGSHRAELLKKNMICFNTRKHGNESIYYNVEALEDAIQAHKKVSFFYFDLDENLQKRYRKDKARYIVDPSALIYNEDNYYLMCYSPEPDGIRNYRVDRMTDVIIEEDPVCDDSIIRETEASDYTEQAFKMYTGTECNAVLQFDNSLIGTIFDKFGEDTKMIRVDKDSCVATVTVRVSPTFWGWLLQFPGRMKLLSPDSLIAEYQAWIGKLCQ